MVTGIDEVGRGPLAGPVVVAAVYLIDSDFSCRIDDSKKLTHCLRHAAFLEIAQKAVFGVGVVSEAVFDEVNISRAAESAADLALGQLFRRMKRAYPQRLERPFLLFDGGLRAHWPCDYRQIIGGDGLSLSIAAASIVAKVLRDRMMDIYDRRYPDYGFARHKGYGTARHRQAIRQKGLCAIHRRSFCRGVLG